MPRLRGEHGRRRTLVLIVVGGRRALADGLRAAVGADPDLESVGAAADVEASSLTAGGRPDVVILDLDLPGLGGVERIRRVKAALPGTRVLVLGADVAPNTVADAARAGAAAVLPRDAPFAEIVALIRSPLEGRLTAVDPNVLAQPGAVPAGLRTPVAMPAVRSPRLTAREREVLQLMGEGLDPASIAERLNVSVHTARGHVKRVMMKLGAHTQLEAVVTAMRRGLIATNGPGAAR